jgi:hypothetical protein
MRAQRTVAVRGCLAVALAGGLTLGAVTGCAVPRSFSELAADAEAVPTPPGVTFVREAQGTNDGPGFTTTKSEEIARQYASALSCAVLEGTWAEVLRAAKRRFRLANHPDSFGATGSLGIEVTDRPEVLGVTIGTDDGRCSHPFVYSFDPPH